MFCSYPLNCHNHGCRDSQYELDICTEVVASTATSVPLSAIVSRMWEVTLKYYANNRRDLVKQYRFFFFCDSFHLF